MKMRLDLPMTVTLENIQAHLEAIEEVRSADWCAGNSTITIYQGTVAKEMPVWVGDSPRRPKGKKTAREGEVVYFATDRARGGPEGKYGYSPYVLP